MTINEYKIHPATTLLAPQMLIRSVYFQRYEMLGRELAKEPRAETFATSDRMLEEIEYNRLCIYTSMVKKFPLLNGNIS